jgi:anti-sigma B factor antagonist
MGIQMTQFSIHAVVNGPQCDLVLSGEVDIQVTDALVRVVHSHLADTAVQCLLLDFGAVTFIDSSGLGALVAIRNAARNQGKDIALSNVSERIRQLLGITGLDGVFGINSSISAGRPGAAPSRSHAASRHSTSPTPSSATTTDSSPTSNRPQRSVPELNSQGSASGHAQRD